LTLTLLGFQRCLIVPRVKVTYDLEPFLKFRFRFGLEKFRIQENENITFGPLPVTQQCEPLKGILLFVILVNYIVSTLKR
jgi:hypothetical protein